MDLLHAFILGVVEGITEFLPISSTGHLILAGKLLNIDQTEFIKSFDIAIQLGAILAVVVLYWRSLFINKKIMLRVASAFIPTAIAGFLLYKVVKKVFLGSTEIVAWSLLIGGILIILFEILHKEKQDSIKELEELPLGKAALIGLFQAIAMVPGVSRSAATILGGLFLGVTRKTIVEFSFLLAVPTMLAATALDLMKNAGSFSSGQFSFLAVGFVTSFVVAILSIKFLLHFIRNHNFISFGIYRIVVGLVFLLWIH